jgi:hypothetical protein
MSGGAIMKALPTPEPTEKPSIFDEQVKNMPCKECKKGQKDCTCEKDLPKAGQEKSPYKIEQE